MSNLDRNINEELLQTLRGLIRNWAVSCLMCLTISRRTTKCAISFLLCTEMV